MRYATLGIVGFCFGVTLFFVVLAVIGSVADVPRVERHPAPVSETAPAIPGRLLQLSPQATPVAL